MKSIEQIMKETKKKKTHPENGCMEGNCEWCKTLINDVKILIKGLNEQHYHSLAMYIGQESATALVCINEAIASLSND